MRNVASISGRTITLAAADGSISAGLRLQLADRAGSCTLPQTVTDACVAIDNCGTTASDDCTADAACTWDATGTTCEATTLASACTAEAADGQTECQGVLSCVYASRVCAASPKAQDLVVASVNGTVITLSADLTNRWGRQCEHQL